MPIQRSLSAFAGYVISGARRFTSVEMTWIQPKVTCGRARPAAVGIWVGVQDSSTHLEQAGSAVFCVRGTSVPIYRAFWEFYPAPPRYFSLRVQPGHTLRARVSVSGTLFTLSVSNLTTGRTASAKGRKSVKQTHAAWIVEAPSSATTLVPLPLAKFSNVRIIRASVTGDGKTRVIDDPAWRVIRLTMRTRGHILASTTQLTSDGRGFTVRWRRSS